MRALALLAVTALLCPRAQADLFTAQVAYHKGDYERAFKDYRELAELGQPLAQFNLAVMYGAGQGVRQSDLNAYAWASLAGQNGYPPGKELADKVRPLLAPGSEQIAADIVAPFGRAALDARLMPRISDDQGTQEQCKPRKRPPIAYPEDADSKGIQGNVYVEFAVMPDGRARNPRILYALPTGVFDDTVRTAVLQAEFTARASGEKAVHCQIMFQFRAASLQGTAGYPQLETLARRTLEKAQAGDVESQFFYGMLLAGLPQLGHGRKDAIPWFLKAAQSGYRQAQFEVGSSLLLGLGCQCEESKGEVWLRKAAEADQSNAQVTLAQFALRGTPDAADTQRAKVWLERAAASGDRDGMLYLSALLAATPVAALRDPPRALSLLDKVRKDLYRDPTEFEIRAAAQASSGAFDQAVKSERKALEMATRLQWDVAPLKERLARYQSSQPWYGNLLIL